MLRLGPVTPLNPLDRLFDGVQKDIERGVREIQRVFGEPDANFAEYEDRYEIQVAVPGLAKEDLDVSVKDRQIEVSAKAQKLIDSEDNVGPRYRFREFGFSGFRRAFPVPRDAKIDGVNARCEKGILTIALPRLANEESLTISIE